MSCYPIMRRRLAQVLEPARCRRFVRRLNLQGRLHFGADRDLASLVDTHLFIMSANNSGSTFLKNVLATSRLTWNLRGGAMLAPGFVGPDIFLRGNPNRPQYIWAAEQRWLTALTDARAYDWRRSREAWHSQAWAQNPRASVFVAKAPPFLCLVDDIVEHFKNARFLFVVRNPYAVCEGICRSLRRLGTKLVVSSPEEAAARHVTACLRWQRRNVETHGERGLFFTYEKMCASPDEVARGISAMVPALSDLNLRQRLVVKNYDSMLTDMNVRQIERLSGKQMDVLNSVFRENRELLGWFGYELIGGGNRGEEFNGGDATGLAANS